MVTVDRTLLEAALYGYERQRDELEAKIAEIRGHISGTKPAPAPAATAASPAPAKKRTMNASARRRIAAAQKKRWAEYKKTHGTATTTAKAAPAKAKRVLSAAARRHIAEATKKRWAEYRAAKAAGQKSSPKTAGKRGGRKVAAPAAETSAT
jgi:hypothetical protein